MHVIKNHGYEALRQFHRGGGFLDVRRVSWSTVNKDECRRTRFGRVHVEGRKQLRLAIIENLKIFAVKIRNDLAARVANHHADLYEVDVHFERRGHIASGYFIFWTLLVDCGRGRGHGFGGG